MFKNIISDLEIHSYRMNIKSIHDWLKRQTTHQTEFGFKKKNQSNNLFYMIMLSVNVYLILTFRL